MAAAVNMDNAMGTGAVRNNHDRDYMVNGVNGVEGGIQGDASSEKRKMPFDAKSTTTAMTNGGYDGTMELLEEDRLSVDPSAPRQSRLNDLPDEIQHISQNFVPLSHLLSRLAQRSHNTLQDSIVRLAQMPSPAAAVNGNLDAHTTPDDTTPENLNKKKFLLNFAQGEHENWVKALVILEWSKKATQVSKLIDLNNHMFKERQKYDELLDEMVNFKRALTFARLPPADLKTAQQVLSHGTAPWMPDLGYIEPPAISARETSKWLDDINTLLSLRMNLEDHERIPYHFQDYEIASGRVTFKVKGEFEVDLTIGDEDFEKQLWFIDFRFLLTPAPGELSENLRLFLEARVNDELANNGLTGCYNFLHEFTLTHKVNEARRQAQQLSQAMWVNSIKVEPLNRAMSIQYWESRYPPTGLKSWIILGVHSGKRPNAAPHPSFTSHLAIRWFRDNKEVKDDEISLDSDHISVECILQTVTARHVKHILSSIYKKLKVKERYAKNQGSLELVVSKNDAADSFLRVQLTQLGTLTIRIDPFTGSFSLSPHVRIFATGENRLNNTIKDASEDSISILDGLRSAVAFEELSRRGKSFGWMGLRNLQPPVPADELRQIVDTRDNHQVVWLKHQEWDPKWQVMISLSLSGDRWFVVEL
jgi:mediator of RNA polymerase II transcription subunit 14